MISAHLPVLQVALPLIAAPLCCFLRRGTLAWLFALAVTWIAFAISLALLASVMQNGTISYHLGNWAPPWGIEYRLDAIGALVQVIVAGIGALVLPYARASIADELSEGAHGLFYTAYLLCFTGLLGMTATGDAFNIFVFMEISSLSTYVLVAMGARKDRRAVTAAYSYLVMGTVGATFFVIGVGLLYMVTGTLNIADLTDRVGELGANRTVQAAFGFVVVGLGLKLAMFPLHGWLPNAYAYAPSMITTFLAATATKVSVYILIRFLFDVFGTRFGFQDLAFSIIFLPLAVVAMFAGSAVAIFQVNLKRMLAYSSVAQIGYIMLGISLASVLGLTAASLHLFNHALMKAALFMALGCVMLRQGRVTIDAMYGLGQTMPWTMAAFVAGGMSLIGVPLTVGFISKWYLIQAAIEQDMWILAALIVASSLLAILYIWRVIEVAYFRPPGPGTVKGEAPLSMLIPLWILVGANFYFGIDATGTVTVATRAAETLIGGGS